MVKTARRIVLALASTAAAVPGITFPINSQVPPVARVLKPFSFAFPATTFSTNSPPLVYSLSEAPAWLQLDSGSRTFSGTPGAGDVGAKNFNLIASDGSGTSVMPVTFIVSEDSGPGLGTPLSQQLSTFGTLTAGQSLILYPSKTFSISFGPGTFTNTDDQTNYYAACANNTPLPAWINFNAKSLSFVGSTPSFTSPTELPQDFGIELTASDVAGFSGAVTMFHIVVSDHIFAFESEEITIECISGQPFNSAALQDRLMLDGKPVQSSDLKSVQADAPNWLVIDQHTLIATGTPPSSTTSSRFTLAVTDTFEDTATTTVVILLNSSVALISGSIDVASATIGTSYSFTFESSLFPVAGTQVAMSLGSATSWLIFDASDLTLHGNVPADLNTQQILLNLTATRDSQSQTKSFELAILDRPPISSSSSLVLTADATITSTSSMVPLPTTQPKVPESTDIGGQGKSIAAAVVLPLAFLGIGLLIYWCFRKKRRARRRIRQRTSSQSSVAAWKKIISRPFLIEEPFPKVIREKPTERHERVPSLPPIIPEIPNIRGIFRNSINPSASKSDQEAKRVSKRDSRTNISHGRSLLQTVASFAKGGRQEQPANFALVGEDLVRPGDIHTARGRSISKSINRSPNGIGHGKAPSGFLPVLDFNGRSSRLSRFGSQPSGGLGHGKGISTVSGGPSGYGGLEGSTQNGSSDGWHTTEGSSNSVSGTVLQEFPKSPKSSVRLVRPSGAYSRTLYPSGPSTSEKSGRGNRLPSSSQATNNSTSATQTEDGQSPERDASTGELPDRSHRSSSWYSQISSPSPLHGSQVPPLPPIPYPKLKSSSSSSFLRKYLPKPLKPQPSNLTVGSEGRFATPIESEDENEGDYHASPYSAPSVPPHAILQGGSAEPLQHPGPLTANGISIQTSIQTWRGSRDMHQRAGDAHTGSGSSDGQSSISSTGSGAEGDAPRVGVGEVGRKVSVESALQRNRPVSRSMRAETEGAFL